MSDVANIPTGEALRASLKGQQEALVGESNVITPSMEDLSTPRDASRYNPTPVKIGSPTLTDRIRFMDIEAAQFGITSENTLNFIDRANKVVMYSKITGEDQAFIWDNFDAIDMHYAPAGQDVGGWDALKELWKYGAINTKIGELTSQQIIYGNDSEAVRLDLAKLKLMLPDISKIKEDFPSIITGPLTMMPQIARTTERSMGFALAAGVGTGTAAMLAGNATGVGLLFMEEPITFSTGFVWGFGAGLKAESGRATLEIEAGLLYQELTGLGIPAEVAKPAAITAGAINAVLEVAKLDMLTKLFPAIKNLGRTTTMKTLRDTITKQLSRGIVQQSLGNIALEGVLRYGTHVSVESAQEFTQEIVSTLFTFAAIDMAGLPDVSGSENPEQADRLAAMTSRGVFGEVKERIRGMMSETIASMAVLQLPSSISGARGAYSEYITSIKQQEDMASKLMRDGNISNTQDLMFYAMDSFGLTPEEATAVEGWIKTYAEARGMTSDAYVSGAFQDVSSDALGYLEEQTILEDSAPGDTAVDQASTVSTVDPIVTVEREDPEPGIKKKVRSLLTFNTEGKALLQAFEGSNAKDFVQQVGHIFYRNLSDDKKASFNNYMGIEDSAEMTIEKNKKFSEDFQNFLEDSTVPDEQAREAFVEMKNEMSETYNNMREVIPEGRRGEYDGMLLRDKQKDPEADFEKTEPKFEVKEGEKIDGLNDKDYYTQTENEEFINNTTITKDQIGIVSADIVDGRREVEGNRIDPSILSAGIEYEKTGTIKNKTFELAKEEMRKRPEKYRLMIADVEGDAATAERIRQGYEKPGRAPVKTDGRGVDPSRERATLAALAKTPKQKANIMSGEVKPIDLKEIDERKGLKTQLKKEKKVGDEAFKEGKRAKGAEVKQKNLEKAVRQHYRDAGKKISAPVPKSVDFRRKEAIQGIQALIDPKMRREDKIQRRKDFEQLLKENPNIAEIIPERVMDKLKPGTKSLNEFTLNELDAIVATVEDLKEIGKVERRIKENAQKRKILQNRNYLIGRMLAVSDEDIAKATASNQELSDWGSDQGYDYTVKDQSLNQDKSNDPFMKKLINGIRAYTLRPGRIADLIDGFQNFKGYAHDILINNVNRAYDAELRAGDKRKDNLTKAMDNIDYKVKELSRVIELHDEKITVDKGLSIWLGWRNKLNQEALKAAYGITDIDIGELENNLLTDNDKVIGEAILQDYADNYNRLREAKIKYDNEDLGKQEFYIPMRRMGPKYEELTVSEQMTAQYGSRALYVDQSFKETRKEVGNDYQTPIQLGLFSQWIKQVDIQEHYINSGQTVKDLQATFRDPQVQRAIEGKLGKSTNTAIEKYINNYANPNLQDGYNLTNKIFRALRQNLAASVLAYNLVTMSKQMPSLLYYLGEAGPGYLLESVWQFVQNPKEMIAMVDELDPQMKHRQMNREIQEFKLEGKTKFQKVRNKIANAGMAPISLIDKVMVTIGWNAVYQQRMNQGVRGESGVRTKLATNEAMADAQASTLRTQPAGSRKDLAQIYTESEMMNTLLQFTNQLNQIYNMATHDIHSKWKAGDKGSAALTSMGLILGGVAIWIMSNQRFPQDEDDWKNLAFSQLGMIPIAGNLAINTQKGFAGGHIPAFTAMERIVGSGINLTDPNRDKDKKEKDFLNLLQGFTQLSGVPHTGPKRVVKVATEGDPWELLGGRKK